MQGGGGGGQQKQTNDSRNNQHSPQYANYWAPLTRKQDILPHPAQPQHTNHWAPRTRKQEHRPQRPTESSDPTQHAKGRTGDCPGPRKETTTKRNVTRGGGGGEGGGGGLEKTLCAWKSFSHPPASQGFACENNAVCPFQEVFTPPPPCPPWILYEPAPPPPPPSWGTRVPPPPPPSKFLVAQTQPAPTPRPCTAAQRTAWGRGWKCSSSGPAGVGWCLDVAGAATPPDSARARVPWPFLTAPPTGTKCIATTHAPRQTLPPEKVAHRACSEQS